jgi:hypothetical protein
LQAFPLCEQILSGWPDFRCHLRAICSRCILWNWSPDYNRCRAFCNLDAGTKNPSGRNSLGRLCQINLE